MDLNQVCSFDAPGFKTCPAPWITNWNMEQKRKTLEFFFPETGQNVCLNDVSDEFRNESCQVKKKYVTGSNGRKSFCTL